MRAGLFAVPAGVISGGAAAGGGGGNGGVPIDKRQATIGRRGLFAFGYLCRLFYFCGQPGLRGGVSGFFGLCADGARGAGGGANQPGYQQRTCGLAAVGLYGSVAGAGGGLQFGRIGHANRLYGELDFLQNGGQGISKPVQTIYRLVYPVQPGAIGLAFAGKRCDISKRLLKNFPGGGRVFRPQRPGFEKVLPFGNARPRGGKKFFMKIRKNLAFLPPACYYNLA